MYKEIYLTDIQTDIHTDIQTDSRRTIMISGVKKCIALLLTLLCILTMYLQAVFAAEETSQHETVKVGFFAMDGYMTTREIRTLRNNRKANIPIVAMTANAFEEDKKKAFKAGMNAHIAKPIDINTILAVFDQVFGV